MNIIFLLLQGLLGFGLTMSGVLKVVPGDNPAKQGYAKVRLPMFWLTPIGLIEMMAGLGLIVGFFVPPLAAVGAVLAVCSMAGAVLAHVVQDKRFDGYQALVLLVLSSIVLWQKLPELLSLWLGIFPQ
jgi:uncharacterized membrane protein YphA (DoxX/SURF4 family)